MTAEPAAEPRATSAGTDPRPAPGRVRTVTVRGVSVRISERPACGAHVDEPPLLLCNGIGVSFEALQPFVDALHPHRGIVRFDVPGVGGSPLPPYPYAIAGLASWLTAVMTSLGPRPLRRARALLGRRPRPAARGPVAPRGSAASCWPPPAPAA